ncbi:hypothetical protein [Amycolatopsis magusensis]|uniref:hypothetical protein n=1 Tax=Amycolatopsis magusensis TaxID=882444 RepID=UPI0037980371
MILGDYPPDLNAEAVLSATFSDEREYWQLWRLYHERRTTGQAFELGTAQGIDPAMLDTWSRELEQLPAMSALQALQANRRLVDLLTGRRWTVMREAREAGATWTEIGEALGMSKQGAHDWYKRQIETQERLLPEYHEAARARAVLDDAPANTAAPEPEGPAPATVPAPGPAMVFDPDTVRLDTTADEITRARRVLTGDASPRTIGFVQPVPGRSRWTASTPDFLPVAGGPWRTQQEALLHLVEHALRSATR